MTIREHKLWPLIEEVGLKRGWVREMGTTQRPPSDLSKIRKAVRNWYPAYRTDYENTIKNMANQALGKYKALLKTYGSTAMPKGLRLYNYGIPPATKRLYEAINK